MIFWLFLVFSCQFQELQKYFRSFRRLWVASAKFSPGSRSHFIVINERKISSKSTHRPVWTRHWAFWKMFLFCVVDAPKFNAKPFLLSSWLQSISCFFSSPGTMVQNRKNAAKIAFHFPTSKGVSEVSKRANEWVQQIAWAKQAGQSKQTSERYERTSERTSEWPSTSVCIFGYSGP